MELIFRFRARTTSTPASSSAPWGSPSATFAAHAHPGLSSSSPPVLADEVAPAPDPLDTLAITEEAPREDDVEPFGPLDAGSADEAPARDDGDSTALEAMVSAEDATTSALEAVVSVEDAAAISLDAVVSVEDAGTDALEAVVSAEDAVSITLDAAVSVEDAGVSPELDMVTSDEEAPAEELTKTMSLELGGCEEDAVLDAVPDVAALEDCIADEDGSDDDETAAGV